MLSTGADEAQQCGMARQHGKTAVPAVVVMRFVEA
jgi:hypothetical protein